MEQLSHQFGVLGTGLRGSAVLLDGDTTSPEAIDLSDNCGVVFGSGTPDYGNSQAPLSKGSC